MELLAAITITTIILGTAFLLFSSVNLEWNTSVNKNNLDSGVSLTTSTISKNLLHTVEMYAFPASGTPNEWRFKTGNGSTESGQYKYKSIRYTVETINGRNAGVLTLYELKDASQFSSTTTAIDYTDSLNYSSKIMLTDQLSATAQVSFKYDHDNNNSTLPIEVSNSILKNGSLLSIELPFQYLRPKTNGQTERIEKPTTLVVKMIKDYI